MTCSGTPTRVIEVGMPSLDLAEGSSNAVPRNRLEVLDEAPPGPVGDRVEADGTNAQVGEERGPIRPRRVVQHREQDGPRAEPPELFRLGASEDHDDVLVQALLVGADPDAIRDLEVGVDRDAHAEPVACLQHDLAGADAVQMRDQIRQEVASLFLLLVHPRQPDGRSHRTSTLGRRPARHPGRRTWRGGAECRRAVTQGRTIDPRGASREPALATTAPRGVPSAANGSARGRDHHPRRIAATTLLGGAALVSS